MRRFKPLPGKVIIKDVEYQLFKPTAKGFVFCEPQQLRDEGGDIYCFTPDELKALYFLITEEVKEDGK